MSTYNKRYYAANKEAHNKQTKRWADLNRERKRAKDREYGKANKARKKAYDAARFKQNAVAVRARASAYFQKHKDDPDFKAKMRVRSDRRRALKKAATVNLAGIRSFIASTYKKPTAICYYCNKRVPSRTVHFDHVIALSKGGAHSVENLCVSCSACNLSKGAKPLLEWARDNASQQLLNL